jgi:hypothetical protein
MAMQGNPKPCTNTTDSPHCCARILPLPWTWNSSQPWFDQQQQPASSCCCCCYSRRRCCCAVCRACPGFSGAAACGWGFAPALHCARTTHSHTSCCRPHTLLSEGLSHAQTSVDLCLLLKRAAPHTHSQHTRRFIRSGRGEQNNHPTPPPDEPSRLLLLPTHPPPQQQLDCRGCSSPAASTAADSCLAQAPSIGKKPLSTAGGEQKTDGRSSRGSRVSPTVNVLCFVCRCCTKTGRCQADWHIPIFFLLKTS